MVKELQVVMLPTEKAMLFVGGIYLHSNKDTLGIITNDYFVEICNSKNHVSKPMITEYKPQHLYLVSDEEIKEGDWFITPGSQLRLRTYAIQPVKADKKVIATTDKSLKIEDKDVYPYLVIPQIPQSFIEEFVEANGKIDKVYIQANYDLNSFQQSDNKPLRDFFTGYKLTDNNEVIISSIKAPNGESLYVRNILTRFALNQNIPIPVLVEWIKENLK
jgi:hypothetical protein